MSEEAWYDGGLRFTCTKCGNCCRGGPGTVRVSDVEIAAIADRLNLSGDEFRSRYTRILRGGDISLTEKGNLDCIFYDRSTGCTVYEDRPRQCRTWPFWNSVVFSTEGWEEAAETCPGMNAGRRYSGGEITFLAGDDGTSNIRKRSTGPS